MSVECKGWRGSFKQMEKNTTHGRFEPWQRLIQLNIMFNERRFCQLIPYSLNRRRPSLTWIIKYDLKIWICNMCDNWTNFLFFYFLHYSLPIVQFPTRMGGWAKWQILGRRREKEGGKPSSCLQTALWNLNESEEKFFIGRFPKSEFLSSLKSHSLSLRTLKRKHASWLEIDHWSVLLCLPQ